MTIFAKYFIALDGNQRLSAANTAQISPYDHYSGAWPTRVTSYGADEHYRRN